MRHDSDKEMISNHLSLMNARTEQLLDVNKRKP